MTPSAVIGAFYLSRRNQPAARCDRSQANPLPPSAVQVVSFRLTMPSQVALAPPASVAQGCCRAGIRWAAYRLHSRERVRHLLGYALEELCVRAVVLQLQLAVFFLPRPIELRDVALEIAIGCNPGVQRVAHPSPIVNGQAVSIVKPSFGGGMSMNTSPQR